MTTKELIRAEIERLIRMNQTKNGFPAGTIRAIRIKAYERLLAFIDTLPDEPVTDCHDLTNAAENSWAVYEYRESPKGLYSTCYVDGFIAGAEWQKRKMMEGAVAVEVVGEKRDLRLIDSTQRCLFDAERGDWLKIIIVKEDEQ